MRTLLFVLAVVAVSVIAGETPVLPKNELCSIKAEGSTTLKTLTRDLAGTATMKRVRDSFRIDVTSLEATFSVIGRGDMGTTKMDLTTCHVGLQTKCYDAGTAISLNDYSYSGMADLPNVAGAYKFTHTSGKAAIYISPDDNKLAGEEFSITLDNIPVTLTVTYDLSKVEAYDRTDAADGAFNSDQCGFAGDDNYALTAKCTDEPQSESGSTPVTPASSSSDTGAAGVIVPSVALLLTAAVFLL